MDPSLRMVLRTRSFLVFVKAASSAFAMRLVRRGIHFLGWRFIAHARTPHAARASVCALYCCEFRGAHHVGGLWVVVAMLTHPTQCRCQHLTCPFLSFSKSNDVYRLVQFQFEASSNLARCHCSPDAASTSLMKTL